MTQRLRNWCFTINNYTDAEYEHLSSLPTIARGSTGRGVYYIVVGKEVADSGTPHLQGYIELSGATRIGGVKQLLACERVHLEPRRGTPLQAAEYCKKEGSWFEHGDVPGGRPGVRSDLHEVSDLIRAGAPAKRILEEHPTSFLRYSRGITAAILLSAKPRDFATQFIWRWGTTGTGKTRDTARESKEFYGDDVAWIPDVSLRWIDGYSGHRGVVLDEFDGTCSLSLLLRVLDRYPLQLQCKGGFVNWSPRIVWITSQFSPEFYYGRDSQWKALARRIVEYGQGIEYLTDRRTEYDASYWREAYEPRPYVFTGLGFGRN